MPDYKNHNSEIDENYCPNCGHPTQLERIDASYIKKEIGDFLCLKRGHLYTIKELAIRPQRVKEFLSESRYRLAKPIAFLLFTSVIYTVVNLFFHIGDYYANEIIGEDATSIKLYKWLEENYGYLNLGMGFFVAFWTKIFFKKYDYNFFEIFILICFFMGVEMLICSLFGIAEVITSTHLAYIAQIAGMAYTVWATGRFFANKPINYVKAFFANILGLVTFFIITSIICGIILWNMQA